MYTHFAGYKDNANQIEDMSCKASQMTEHMFDFYGEQEMMRQCWSFTHLGELVKPDYESNMVILREKPNAREAGSHMDI